MNLLDFYSSSLSRLSKSIILFLPLSLKFSSLVLPSLSMRPLFLKFSSLMLPSLSMRPLFLKFSSLMLPSLSMRPLFLKFSSRASLAFIFQSLPTYYNIMICQQKSSLRIMLEYIYGFNFEEYC